MSRTPVWMSLAAAAIAVGAGVRAQTPAQTPGQPSESGFTTSTTAVVVDVVVRDAKGAPVTDLKASDFDLLEDDVRQRITSVELIAPGRRAAASKGDATGTAAERSPAAAGDGAPAGTAEGTPAASGPTMIALAFHRLSPDARVLAWRAARSYIDGAIAPNDFAGVFLVDTGLQTMQTFTTDREKLAAAVEKVARTQTTIFTRNQPLSALLGDASPDVSPTASAESVGRPANESGFQPRKRLSEMSQSERAARSLQDMAERMENTFEEMMLDRNGHAETAALTALASSMGSLPGRKRRHLPPHRGESEAARRGRARA